MPTPTKIKRLAPVAQDFALIAVGKAPHKRESMEQLKELGLVRVIQEDTKVAELTPMGERFWNFHLSLFEDIERIFTPGVPTAALEEYLAGVNIAEELKDESLSPEARTALEAGLKSAKESPPVYLGSFAQYAEGKED